MAIYKSNSVNIHLVTLCIVKISFDHFTLYSHSSRNKQAIRFASFSVWSAGSKSKNRTVLVLSCFKVCEIKPRFFIVEITEEKASFYNSIICIRSKISRFSIDRCFSSSRFNAWINSFDKNSKGKWNFFCSFFCHFLCLDKHSPDHNLIAFWNWKTVEKSVIFIRKSILFYSWTKQQRDI